MIHQPLLSVHPPMGSMACINVQFHTERNVLKPNHLNHSRDSRKVIGSRTGSQAASQIDYQINRNTPNMNVLLDERITGRVGSSILPVLPVQTIPVPKLEEKLPHWPTHKQQVEQILDQHGITDADGKTVQVAYRQHPESKLHDKHITILVIAEYGPDSKTTWPEAVREILRYLYEVKVQYMVEIIADALDVGPECFPFATDVYQWNNVLMPAVCSLVHGRDWLTLQMVYVEDIRETDEKQPTIFIGARDADEKSWWDETLPAIRNLPHVAHSDIQVVLKYQHRYLTSDADSIVLEKSFRNAEIPMGASCGRGAPTGTFAPTGTLGGRMVLKDPRTSVLQSMSITNHHVLCSDLAGQGPFTKFEPPIKVESPSKSDHNQYQTTLREKILSTKNRLKEVIERQYRYDAQEFQNKKDSAMAELNQLEDLLSQAEAFDTHVGQVHASSGFRYARKDELGEWALDWSLTTTNRGVSHHTKAPNLNEERSVTKYCTIKSDRGYRVFKTGRTSGTTIGFISATQAKLRWRTIPRPKHGPTVQLADLRDYPEKHARCHVMIPEPNPRSDYFIKRGDSGSLILLDPHNFALPGEEEKPSATAATTSGGDGGRPSDAYIVGLGFAASDYAFISYMMPMDLIVKDIEEVTHLKVVEPSNIGIFPPPSTNSLA